MEEEKSRSVQIVEEAIKAYPNLKVAYAELKKQSGGQKDPTATAALRELPFDDQQRYEAVQRAINKTRRLPYGTQRRYIIQFSYWQGPLSLEEISARLELPVGKVKEYKSEFLQMVKAHLDTSGCLGCIHLRELVPTVRACFYCIDTGQLRLNGSADDRCTPCPFYTDGMK